MISYTLTRLMAGILSALVALLTLFAPPQYHRHMTVTVTCSVVRVHHRLAWRCPVDVDRIMPR